MMLRYIENIIITTLKKNNFKVVSEKGKDYNIHQDINKVTNINKNKLNVK